MLKNKTHIKLSLLTRLTLLVSVVTVIIVYYFSSVNYYTLNILYIRPSQPLWQQMPTAVSSKQLLSFLSKCLHCRRDFSYPSQFVSKMRIWLEIGPNRPFAGTDEAYFRSLQRQNIHASECSTYTTSIYNLQVHCKLQYTVI